MLDKHDPEAKWSGLRLPVARAVAVGGYIMPRSTLPPSLRNCFPARTFENFAEDRGASGPRRRPFSTPQAGALRQDRECNRPGRGGAHDMGPQSHRLGSRLFQ